jgi:type I restriction enzyme S subunit
MKFCSRKLKYCCSLKGRIGWQNLRSDEFTAEGPFLITGMHFADGRVDWDRCFHVSPERYAVDSNIHVRSGDLLITKDGSVGKLAHIDSLPGPACLNSHLLIIRPKCGYPSTRFLFYLLQTERFERYILEEQSGTTFQGLSQASVANFEAALPKSFEDQLSIAKFLDSATSAIDTLIEKKQRLIDLLDERRAELISRAVMQGLDPDTPMKDSGIQWLRRPVPAHWELRRVKDCCIAVVDCKNRTPPSVEGGEFLVVRTPNVRGGQLDLGAAITTDKASYIEWTKRGAPKLGDIFFTREAPAGEACLVPDNRNLCMGQRMMYFRPNPEIMLPGFLLATIYGRLVRTYIERSCNGTTVGHLKLGQVASLPVLWCPISEQAAILRFIESQSQRIDKAAALARRGCDLLRQYRCALITAAVTGQLDIREHEKKMEALA